GGVEGRSAGALLVELVDEAREVAVRIDDALQVPGPDVPRAGARDARRGSDAEGEQRPAAVDDLEVEAGRIGAAAHDQVERALGPGGVALAGGPVHAARRSDRDELLSFERVSLQPVVEG